MDCTTSGTYQACQVSALFFSLGSFRLHAATPVRGPASSPGALEDCVTSLNVNVDRP